eukprot:3293275-Amphidinium_carterae.1
MSYEMSMSVLPGRWALLAGRAVACKTETRKWRTSPASGGGSRELWSSRTCVPRGRETEQRGERRDRSQRKQIPQSSRTCASRGRTSREQRERRASREQREKPPVLMVLSSHRRERSKTENRRSASKYADVQKSQVQRRY